MKKFLFALKFIGIGLLTAVFCILLLVLSSMIPNERIKEHSIESANYYEKNDLFAILWENHPATMQDNYADCIVNSIIYHIDPKHPFLSSFKASYYKPELMNVNTAFAEAVQKPYEPNIDYYRYWHGSMVLQRPLLIFTDIQGTRLFLGISVLLLCLISVGLIWQLNEPSLAVCFLLSLLFLQVPMILFCIEYVMVFLVMSIILLLLLLKCRKRIPQTAKDVVILFLISGIMTAFFDFLTVETITYTIPVAVLIILMYHKGYLQSISSGLKFLCSTGLSWMIGYSGMFASKWMISALLFGKEALENSLDMAVERISGNVTLDNTNLTPNATIGQRLLGIFAKNWGCVLNCKGDTSYGSIIVIFIAIILIGISLVYLFHTKKQNQPLFRVLLFVSLLPYLRYLILSNHSYLHFFFTYRAQVVTVMIFLYWVYHNSKDGILQLFCHKPNQNNRKNKR